MSAKPVHTLTRLAVVTETWRPEVNGVAHTIGHLVDGLRARGDYHIELVRPRQQRSEQPQTLPGFSECLVGGLTLPFYREVRLGLPQYRTLKQRWSRQRPDMAQIVTEGPLGFAALRAARSLGIPLISDFHTHFDQYSRYYHARLLFRLAQRYLRHLHNHTLLTLVPTRELKQQLADKGYERLAILARGVDTALFNPARRDPELRRRLGVQPEQLLVALVTRLAQEKNLDLAFDAFRALQRQTPDARFLLVGDGPERKRLEKQHLDCLFAGMQTGERLAAHYASADLFLYPSTSETFGNVVLEAMACGLPVVSYDYAAAHEYIRHGVNGMTAPLDDHAAFIAASVVLGQDAALRARLGQAASQTTRRIGWGQVVEQLHTIIQSILHEESHENPASAQRT